MLEFVHRATYQDILIHRGSSRLFVRRSLEGAGLESEGTDRGDSVLAGPRFCDDLLLAHPQAHEGLAQRVVDLVSPCVVQILPLQVDLGPPAVRPAPRPPAAESYIQTPNTLSLAVVRVLCKV
jgi:hypothetical protein